MEAVQMTVENIFYLSDGLTVFVGKLTGQVSSGKKTTWKVLKDENEIQQVIISSFRMSSSLSSKGLTALETRTKICDKLLDAEKYRIELVKIID
ncbi:hypothetical protein ACE193_03745 [Bernardetia sp. OM2101]|uniref:hypothetical protein n=1 Tax=Bernardetia sp. OM2101 TaxID=3344876 RepID=UPI0035CE89E8